MIAKRTDLAGTSDRPFNNLLRRLNAADYALLAPHLAEVEAAAGELLYNPGDDVQIVHFPCGPSLASYMVANEDGRDVETILVGREGAVGGIVSMVSSSSTELQATAEQMTANASQTAAQSTTVAAAAEEAQ